MRLICPLCSSKNLSELALVQSKNYLKCRRCRLVYLDPEHHLDRDSERERYQRHQNSPEDPDYRKFLGRLTEPLIPKLAAGAEGLDYGSGPGPTLSVMFEEQGFPMKIFDPFFAPDIKVLDRTYDFITCTETVEHFRDPAAEFNRLDRLLKAGGWLGIMTEMLESEDRFSDWYYHRDPTHVSFFGWETMDWMASRYRWRVEYPHRNITLFQKHNGASGCS